MTVVEGRPIGESMALREWLEEMRRLLSEAEERIGAGEIRPALASRGDRRLPQCPCQGFANHRRRRA